MARTPLLARLLDAWRSQRRQIKDSDPLETSRAFWTPPQSHQPGGAAISRRGFLRVAALGTLATCAIGQELAANPTRSTGRPGRSPQRPRIAVVGAGLAGLVAADALVSANARVLLFDARPRIGGRVRTLPDALGPDIPAELGGEFINSDHKTMLALARRFNLPLLDTATPGEENFRPVYFMNGAAYPLDRAARDLRDFFTAHKADIAAAETAPGAAANPESATDALRQLDATSISDYLQHRNCPEPLRSLLETAYTTEYGRDASEQSCLNMLVMFAGEDPATWKTHRADAPPDILGSSDERYKIAGGNESVARALAAAITAAQPEAAPRLEHRLAAIRPASADPAAGITLVFEQAAAATVEHTVDRAIIAIPFNQLRHVDLSALRISQAKDQIIDHMGYGRSSKLILGTPSRPWRDRGHDGSCYFDEPSPILTWDTSRARPGDTGGITLFLGGTGTGLLNNSNERALELLRPSLQKALPELAGLELGRILRAHWPKEQFIEAGYSAFAPGQWTTMSGLEARPEFHGRLLFAGEHTSVDHQGYMEGAAESGVRAAKEALAVRRSRA